MFHFVTLGAGLLSRIIHHQEAAAVAGVGLEAVDDQIFPNLRVEYLTQAAQANNQWAQYALGKYYLEQGDREQAHACFVQSADQGNGYAQFFLDRWDSLKPPSVMVAASRLLHHMSRIFRDTPPLPTVPGGAQIDRKLLSKIWEKKISMGHKPDDHEEQRQGMGGMTAGW